MIAKPFVKRMRKIILWRYRFAVRRQLLDVEKVGGFYLSDRAALSEQRINDRKNLSVDYRAKSTGAYTNYAEQYSPGSGCSLAGPARSATLNREDGDQRFPTIELLRGVAYDTALACQLMEFALLASSYKLHARLGCAILSLVDNVDKSDSRSIIKELSGWISQSNQHSKAECSLFGEAKNGEDQIGERLESDFRLRDRDLSLGNPRQNALWVKALEATPLKVMIRIFAQFMGAQEEAMSHKMSPSGTSDSIISWNCATLPG